MHFTCPLWLDEYVSAVMEAFTGLTRVEKPDSPCVLLPSHIRHAEVIHKDSSVVVSKARLFKRVLNADVFIRAFDASL